MSSEVNPRHLLTEWGARPKKKFGQNFLMDAGASRRIAHLVCDDAPAGVRVIEIGAGTGSLTHALLEAGASVTALEIDPELVTILGNRADLAPATIVLADALIYDYAAYARAGAWRVAGNLPYNIATPLLLALVEMAHGPDVIVAMIQKDVADRIGAKPGTAAYGSLSLAVQYAMQVERAFTLGPRAFYPAPKVDSTVVRLVRRAEPAVHPRDLELFRKVVRGAFAYRRKTLANSLALALHIDRDVIAAAISRSDVPAESRGEQLDLQAFCRLADNLAER
ncbi:MAG: 16S rRNA (adenine(1518)-N(6)/adenine(1519)-N(6))-dimethyltransferase RsmA [Candidatus Aquilonibacter sp.]